MIAAGAKAVIVGAKKRRTVPVEKVATGPGQTCLGNDELIESITLPKPGPRTGDAYLRFIPRTEMDIAVVGVAVCVTLNAVASEPPVLRLVQSLQPRYWCRQPRELSLEPVWTMRL